MTFEVVHNQTDSPTFNPRMFKVAINGGTIISKERKSTRIHLGRGPLVGILKNFSHDVLMHRFIPYKIVHV
jgi:hypothetical protein